MARRVLSALVLSGICLCAADNRPYVASCPEDQKEFDRQLRYHSGELKATERIVNARSYNQRAEAYCRWTSGMASNPLMGMTGTGMTGEELEAYYEKLLVNESATREEEQIRQHDLEVLQRVTAEYEGDVHQCKLELLNGYGKIPSDEQLAGRLNYHKGEIEDIRAHGPNRRSACKPAPEPENSMPVLISKVEPEYSAQARAAKYSGSVLVGFDVGPDGNVTNVRVIRPLGLGLDEKAIEAVGRWKFRPGRKAGEAVTMTANAEVSFRTF